MWFLTRALVLIALLVPMPGQAAPSADAGIVTAIADVTVTSTATVVKAANGSRVSLSCTNTSASVNVRWGDSSVTSTKGQQLKAGAAIEIRNMGAVYMVSEGANVTVSCTEETR